MPDRNTPYRNPDEVGFPVAAATSIDAGKIIVLNAGYAEEGSAAVSLVAVGRSEEAVDNSAGADGDKTVRVLRKKQFKFDNSAAADEITQADVGNTCYIVDGSTVAKTDDTGARSAAGQIMGVDAGGVWVEI